MEREVFYSKEVGRKLEKSLRVAFNPQAVLTKPPARRDSGFCIQLTGDRTAQVDDGLTQEVSEITVAAPSGSADFYFGFVACFQPATPRTELLADASLSIFHNIGGELIPFFRAEWHREAALCKKSEHAQPHWHFSQSPSRIESLVRELTRPLDEGAEFSPLRRSDLFAGLADPAKFHFAMTSMWGKNDDPPPKRIFETIGFLDWFDGLTHYIADQVTYIGRRSPVASPAFTPHRA